jgi:hypothetical protein
MRINIGIKPLVKFIKIIEKVKFKYFFSLKRKLKYPETLILF